MVRSTRRVVTHIDPTPDMARWLEAFAASQWSLTRLLCEGHPGDAIALTVESSASSIQQLTYGELQQACSQCSGLLGELEVKPGDRVATLMETGVELAAVLLGIWQVEAVHVPLSTSLSSSAVASRLARSGARVLFCDEKLNVKLKPRHSAPGFRVVTVPRWNDGFWTHQFVAQPARPEAAAVRNDVGHIRLYTSGASTPPKGIVVPVEALVFAAGLSEDATPRDEGASGAA